MRYSKGSVQNASCQKIHGEWQDDLKHGMGLGL
jgi:hypothetical protein